MALSKTSRALSRFIAGIEQAIDLGAVFGPLLDLIEVAPVGMGRIVGFIVGPVTHRRTPRFAP
jgi:hypothetical protein